MTLAVGIHRQANTTGTEESQLALPLQMPDTGAQGAITVIPVPDLRKTKNLCTSGHCKF